MKYHFILYKLYYFINGAFDGIKNHHLFHSYNENMQEKIKTFGREQ